MDDLPSGPVYKSRQLSSIYDGQPTLFLPQSDHIRVARPDDLRFVDHLQKVHGNALGFLPKVALEACITGGHIQLALQNDDSAGYILARTKLRWCPSMRSITQAAVCMDAQRRHVGLSLLERIEAECKTRGQIAIQACCAIGLEANEFWRAAGFIPIAFLTPENVRGREIICWRKPLVSKLPIWFSQLPKFAGHRARPPVSTHNPRMEPNAFSTASRYAKTKASADAKTRTKGIQRV